MGRRRMRAGCGLICREVGEGAEVRRSGTSSRFISSLSMVVSMVVNSIMDRVVIRISSLSKEVDINKEDSNSSRTTTMRS
jgi:hypothetical protein